MSDVFTPYETGLAHLLERLGQDYPRYAEALTLQSSLLENIAQARRYGDTETRRADWVDEEPSSKPSAPSRTWAAGGREGLDH